ncbi:methylamine utilization protein [Psychrosphaera sp. B3R10]|uniref:Methylamine utilization protein n=1 Tax=Psychrosphaera algicola TaxID=3023714 RepID=A0ABT5FA70_9GAMM|nr:MULTISPECIES: methylamine utilization protein [unclassified Psychrosphaera]MBU2880850.1 methylamine utilization protein [Psychrosphaera sp. I2R16]MBU2990931.1 methylamine utilization protein [Psychrosphaera sp. B3R10]MDC2887527.1 methylamine utilization protein [Psychrosphaera sp. G1-22]
MNKITLSLLMFLCSLSIDAKTLHFADPAGTAISNVVVKFSNQAVDKSLTKPVAIMDQVDIQFAPYVLLIDKGQQVAFPNRDDVRHHVYSFSKTKPFEIKLYKNTPTDPVTFSSAGVVELGCNIHDKMIGYIYVTDQANTFLSDSEGNVNLPESMGLASTMEFQYWHPRLSTNRLEHKKANLSDPIEATQIITLSLLNNDASTKQQKRKTRFGKTY